MQRNREGQKKMFCPTDSTPAVIQGASGNHLAGLVAAGCTAREAVQILDAARTTGAELAAALARVTTVKARAQAVMLSRSLYRARVRAIRETEAVRN